MRKVITAILVDPNRVEELRTRRLSFSEIFNLCDYGPGQRVSLTPLQATEFEASSFGYYAGRGRMILAMCRRDFAKLRDLSAVAGFDRTGETEEKGKPITLDAGWIGTFLRDRFEKGRRCL